MIWTDPLATDNSEKKSKKTCSVDSESHFEIGKTDFFCEAQDPYGNNASCLFNVDVQGNNVPKLSSQSGADFILTKFHGDIDGFVTKRIKTLL